ncbi:MAG TPA: hypothetical protein VIN11_06140 [Roseivirga sp.]
MSSHLILIAGISRSGKSSLASELARGLQNAIHLEQDQFVLPETYIPKIEDRIDWERPESIDWLKWHQTISEALKSYRFIIAEGIFAFNDLKLIQRASATIELLIKKDQFLRRRKNEVRWGKEPEWFLEHVWEAHLKYHNPHAISPTLQLNNYSAQDIDLVIRHIQSF